MLKNLAEQVNLSVFVPTEGEKDSIDNSGGYRAYRPLGKGTGCRPVHLYMRKSGSKRYEKEIFVLRQKRTESKNQYGHYGSGSGL